MLGTSPAAFVSSWWIPHWLLHRARATADAAAVKTLALAHSEALDLTDTCTVLVTEADSFELAAWACGRLSLDLFCNMINKYN